eukprot:TRINITY_DN5475_c0_g1_i1.p1 TRINITY_DN5475_c0_g1~~TRINITY_DN5475_c0_g1_i1.p1  ORF type:complete len:180 (+),score=51.85 TRINITY_DN5475_c0_g1_i1:82-621(+)
MDLRRKRKSEEEDLIPIQEAPDQAQFKVLNVLQMRSQILDLAYEEKDLDRLCFKIVSYLSTSLKVEVGALFLGTEMAKPEYFLFQSYPSLTHFSIFFDISQYEHILKASHSNRPLTFSKTLPSGFPFNFLLIPLSANQNSPSTPLAVLCFGTFLKGVLEKQMEYLQHISHIIAISRTLR